MYFSKLFIYLFIIESCTEHKQNIVNITVQRTQVTLDQSLVDEHIIHYGKLKNQ